MLLPSFRSAISGALAAATAVHALPQSNSGSGSGSGSSKACNNFPELCSRNYNNITHMGAHGSSFLRGSATISAAGNQNYNATDALNAGLRLLQAQVHENENALHLCHTSCSLLDAGLLKDWLAAINNWMNDNPNEVVTILLVNWDKTDASEYGKIFNSTGISDIAFTPSSEGPMGDWPTLGDMIDNKQRLVTFVTNTDPSTEYPYLMPQFDYVFETAFEVTEIDGFNCTLDRPSRLDDAPTALASNYLSLVNHFKYQTLASNVFIPDVSEIDTVNSAGTQEGNLGGHLQQCQKEWGSRPNFVLVDLFEEGDVLAATDRMNGVSGASGRTKISELEGEDDESKGSIGDRRMGMGALAAFVAAAVLLV